MERDDVRQVMERLEAIAALSTLFKNLWYAKIKDEVEGEKVRAYLTVYEDAVPQLNHVLEFAHHSAALLADGRLDQDKYERLQSAFGQLSAALLGRPVDSGAEMPGLDELESAVEISPEQEAEMEGDLFAAEDLRTVPRGQHDSVENRRLEGVSQAEVEALLGETHNGTPATIDSLFESTENAAPASSQEEIDALLEEPAKGTDDLDDLDDLLHDEAIDNIGEDEAADEVERGEENGKAEDDLDELLASATEEEEAEGEVEEPIDLGDLELEDETPAEGEHEESELDLGDLELEDTGSDEPETAAPAAIDLDTEIAADETDLDLSDLDLGDDQDETGDLDLSDFAEDEGSPGDDVADDDLTALLSAEEDEAEEEPEPPKPVAKPVPVAAKPAAKAAAKAEPPPKAPAPAPKAPPAAKAAAKPAPAPAKAAPTPAKPAAKPAPKAAPAKAEQAEDDSISQDEIDALFG